MTCVVKSLEDALVALERDASTKTDSFIAWGSQNVEWAYGYINQALIDLRGRDNEN